MKLLALGFVVWITGAFLTVVFVGGAARLSAWKEPEQDEDLEQDLHAAAELALDDVYGQAAYRSARTDPPSTASLERQVVRAAVPGERPRPVGLR